MSVRMVGSSISVLNKKTIIERRKVVLFFSWKQPEWIQKWWWLFVKKVRFAGLFVRCYRQSDAKSNIENDLPEGMQELFCSQKMGLLNLESLIIVWMLVPLVAHSAVCSKPTAFFWEGKRKIKADQVTKRYLKTGSRPEGNF